MSVPYKLCSLCHYPMIRKTSHKDENNLDNMSVNVMVLSEWVCQKELCNNVELDSIEIETVNVVEEIKNIPTYNPNGMHIIDDSYINYNSNVLNTPSASLVETIHQIQTIYSSVPKEIVVDIPKDSLLSKVMKKYANIMSKM